MADPAAEENDEDADFDSDASTDIEVVEPLEDKMEDEEAALGFLDRLLPRLRFWETFFESLTVKTTFLCSPQTIGSYMWIYIVYGPKIFLPTIVLLTFCVGPLLFMELSLGQYTSMSAFAVYKRMVPAFAGVGIAVMMLNFLLIGTQVQQAAVYIGLLSEATSMGDSQKQYEMCTASYNNQYCFVSARECPKYTPLLMENECTSYTSAKLNRFKFVKQNIAKDMPFVFPLYQFMYRGVLGEADKMFVRANFPSSAIVTFAVIWLFLLFLQAKGGVSVIRKMAVISNTLFLSFCLCYHVIWRYYERPFAYNTTELALIDTSFRRRSFDLDANFNMWINCLMHIITTIGIGDGGIMMLASRQEFSSSLLLDVAAMLTMYFMLPAAVAYFLKPHVVAAIFEMMYVNGEYYEDAGQITQAYHAFISNMSYHATAFPLALSLTVFKDFDNGLITIFSVTFLMCVLTVIVIRIEIILGAICDHIHGLVGSMRKNVLRAVLFMAFLVMLTTVNRHGLHIVEAFYYQCIISTCATIVGLEMIMVLLYGWKRIYANLNAMQLNWSIIMRSRKVRAFFECTNLMCIIMWIGSTVLILMAAYVTTTYDPDDSIFATARAARYMYYVIVLFPVAAIALKKIATAWRSNTKLIFVLQPERRLWGPRLRADRQLAAHVEREFGVRE